MRFGQDCFKGYLVSCGCNGQLNKWSLNAVKKHFMEGKASKALEHASGGGGRLGVTSFGGVKNRLNRSSVPGGGVGWMSVCMGGCTCMHVHTCMGDVHASVCMHGGNVHACVHTCVSVCICGCMHAQVWGCMCLHACMCMRSVGWS